MQKVITINLNGVAYQIDESGYTALVAYLEGAQRQLADNPDRAEIVADLEQAIADKCRGFLGTHKTVVAAAEVDQIIREMGPVDGAGGADAGGGADPKPASTAPVRSPKRLYRISEGAMWMGVCNGLAAYTGIDVVFVRIAFIVLVVWTAGLGILGYWILASIIPEASTSDERAAASGQAPFNAQQLIDRAKQNYADFTSRGDWRRKWRQEQRAWRRQWRSSRWHASRTWGAAWAPPPPVSPAAYGTRVMTGVMVPILGIAGALWFFALAWAIYSLVTTGQVLGEPLPDELPLWGGILILVVAYHVVVWPLRVARRRAAYYSFGRPHYGLIGAWDGMMSLVLGAVMVWLAYHYLPEIREIVRTVPDVWNSLVNSSNP